MLQVLLLTVVRLLHCQVTLMKTTTPPSTHKSTILYRHHPPRQQSAARGQVSKMMHTRCGHLRKHTPCLPPLPTKIVTTHRVPIPRMHMLSHHRYARTCLQTGTEPHSTCITHRRYRTAMHLRIRPFMATAHILSPSNHQCRTISFTQPPRFKHHMPRCRITPLPHPVSTVTRQTLRQCLVIPGIHIILFTIHEAVQYRGPSRGLGVT